MNVTKSGLFPQTWKSQPCAITICNVAIMAIIESRAVRETNALFECYSQSHTSQTYFCLRLSLRSITNLFAMQGPTLIKSFLFFLILFSSSLPILKNLSFPPSKTHLTSPPPTHTPSPSTTLPPSEPLNLPVCSLSHPFACVSNFSHAV